MERSSKGTYRDMITSFQLERIMDNDIPLRLTPEASMWYNPHRGTYQVTSNCKIILENCTSKDVAINTFNSQILSNV